MISPVDIPESTSDKTHGPAQTLRQRAEKKLETMPEIPLESLGPENITQLLHDLRMRHIEMEIKNEDLCQIRHELESTLEKRTTELSAANAALIDEIAERKHIEASLRKSEAFFKQSQRVNNVGHYVLDVMSGNWSSSEMLDHIFGIGKNDTKNLACFLRVIHPEHQKDVIKLFNGHLFDEGKPFDHEYRIFNAIDQTVRWVHGIGNVERDDEGRAIKMFGTIQDITDRKRLEAEKAKFETQNQHIQKSESLGRMAGAIAHKFNNLLGVVIGNTELAMEMLHHDAEPRKHLAEAIKAASNAAEVTRMMLSYLGQPSGSHETQDLSKLCHRNLCKLQASIPEKIDIKFDLPTPGPIIKANAYQIEQILIHLITNAWEAIGDSPSPICLTIKTIAPENIARTHRFPMDWQAQNNPYACIELSDKGCGISKENINQIFDPFFTSKSIGRGLGLSVTLGILRSHGGVITVESQKGRGSIFRVFFPISTDTVHQLPEKMRKDPVVGMPLTILLVEDEPAVRKMTKEMLTRMGYLVFEAKDGIEAVEVFQQNKGTIHCVLSDLTMPRMDGWETLTALRKIEPGIPVILTSGYDQAQVMVGDHLELPQAYLNKPYQLAKLREAIQAALGNNNTDL